MSDRDATSELRGMGRQPVDVDDIASPQVAEHTPQIRAHNPTEDGEREPSDLIDLLHERRHLVEVDEPGLDGVGGPLKIWHTTRYLPIAMVEHDDRAHTSVAAEAASNATMRDCTVRKSKV
jgi:hypothetical protein